MSLRVKVISNQPAGDGVYLMELEPHELGRGAMPGQFVMLKPVPGRDPLLARPFSIHGLTENSLLVLYKVLGRGTALLSRLSAGDIVEAWGPLGAGYNLDYKKPLLLAGGMGIASLAFAASYLQENGVEPESIYGAATVRDLVEGYYDSDGRYFIAGTPWQIITEDGTYGETGLITGGLAEKLAGIDGVLACGPLPMLKAVAQVCAENQVQLDASLEAPMACGLGACLGCAVPASGGGYLRVCKEGPVVEAGKVDWQRV
jgi:dihydroorotate dehydrogenase electron transfer subunit